MSKTMVASDQMAEYQDIIARCIEAAREIVKTDVSLRPPVKEEERANRFAAWIEKYHVKYLPQIEEIVRREFAGTALVSEPERFRDVVECRVWPEIRALLEAESVDYYAGAWARKYMGDATFLMLPTLEEGLWHVPVGVQNWGENLGEIVLDTEGNVIPHLTTTREQLHERLDEIDDRRLSSVKAAAGQ